ncbi:MAG: exodeoxyribonuclease [Pseudomonadota bacterium]|jgi:exodeoxyribonuclease-3
MTTVASWNVNSLKVRMPHLGDWLGANPVDVIGLQETKLVDENFPQAEIEALGYHVLRSGQKTYNGVALLARQPISDVRTELDGLYDPQRRVAIGTVGGVRYLNLYVPNGQAVGSEKYEYKLRWLDALHRTLQRELATHDQVVVMGDFNIAPDDRDVHDPVAWAGQILCSDAERGALRGLLELGLADSFRLFEQPPATFSWWDYRQAGFRRNLGLRIDLILASKALRGRCLSSTVDTAPRKLERPSDHAPVVARFGPP